MRGPWDEAATHIHRNNAFAAYAAQTRPVTGEPEGRQRMHNGIVMTNDAFYWNVDESTDNDRHHQRSSCLRADVKLAKSAQHDLAEHDGKQNQQQKRERQRKSTVAWPSSVRI
jgi:hypothetical protein